jgi:hypothetical protein
MKRKKIEKEEDTEDIALTEENAASILGRYTQRSCRGGVQLYFEIRPGADVPEELIRHCNMEDADGPDSSPGLLPMSTKGEIRDGKLIGYALKGQWNNCVGEIRDGATYTYTPEEMSARRDDSLHRIEVPLAMIGPGILFIWHEWE